MTDEQWNSTVEAFATEVTSMPFTSLLVLFLSSDGEQQLRTLASGAYDPGDPNTWVPRSMLDDRVQRLMQIVTVQIDRRFPVPT